MFGASINAKNFTLCIVIYISLVSLCFVEIHCFQQETLTCWRWLCGEYQNLFWLDLLKNIKIVQSINMLLLTLNSAMTKELGNMCGIIYVVKQKSAIIVILNGGKFNTLTTYLLIYCGGHKSTDVWSIWELYFTDDAIGQLNYCIVYRLKAYILAIYAYTKQ